MPGFAATGLDVVIGLSFVFLVISLAAASVREAIASVLNSRAARLEEAIANLLGDPEQNDVAEKFFENPLINALSTKHVINDKKVGSYLPSRTFALALLDTLRHDVDEPDDVKAAQKAVDDATKNYKMTPSDASRQALAAARVTLGQAWASAPAPTGDKLAQAWKLVAKLPEGAIQRQLQIVVEDADADVAKLRAGIERVYDEAMERVSGWYKRRSQLVILVVAILIAAAGNIDSIAIGSALWKDPTVRAAVVAAAQKTEDTKTEKSAAAAVDELAQLQLPVGWSKTKGDPRSFPTTASAGVGKVAGILITAFAALLGAPFWFSALGRLAPLRATGAKPATTATAAAGSA
jgi:hypothetical protein